MLFSKRFASCVSKNYRFVLCRLPQNNLRVLSANFHVSIKSAKVFVDAENQFAHEVLEQSLKSYQLFRPDIVVKNVPTIPPQKDLREPPSNVLHPKVTSGHVCIDELFKNFCNLVEYCAETDIRLSDSRFSKFIQIFCDESHRLTDEQLMGTLGQLKRLPMEDSVKAPNYVELWNALDAECSQRVDGWNTDRLLYVCDIWYSVYLARISDFVEEAIRRLGRKVRKMKPEQLVHTMFFCNLMRRQIYDMFDFEENLAKCAHEMSLQELGVMSMGFFKTQTPIRNPELLEHLYRRLMTELDVVKDITLVAIIKVLRYSSKLPQVDLMMELMKGLCNQVERISLLACVHVALLGSDLQCCHDPLLECVLVRFNRDIGHARLKDLERICFAISLFNYRSPLGLDNELYKNIIMAMDSKIDEIIKHPRCFPTCLHFLSIKGHYDPEMISSALDLRFIRHAYSGKNMVLGREIFQLDSFVKINLKDSNYEGNQLPEKYRRTMGKVLTNYIPERNPKYKLNTTDRILLEIKDTMDRIFRKNTFKHILPHFERPDIVMCYDRKSRRALPLPQTCPEDYSGIILTRKELLGESEAAHIDTIAIVVEGWNNAVRDKQRYTGLFDMKLQQLKLLGHKYIVINWHKWRELETQQDRQNFLKRRLATITIL